MIMNGKEKCTMNNKDSHNNNPKHRLSSHQRPPLAARVESPFITIPEMIFAELE
jgi:hypothetical protein